MAAIRRLQVVPGVRTGETRAHRYRALLAVVDDG
jgi:hypothetical protein